MSIDLHTLKIFSGIPKAMVDEIIACAGKEEYPQGSIILKEGDPSNGKAYIITQGKVAVIIKGNTVHTLETGDIFGEIALLSQEPRTATIQALTDVSLLTVTENLILLMINNGNESINRDIMKRIEENILLENQAFQKNKYSSFTLGDS